MPNKPSNGYAILAAAIALLTLAGILAWTLWKSLSTERSHSTLITESFTKSEPPKR
jgi:hypothetical protein